MSAWSPGLLCGIRVNVTCMDTDARRIAKLERRSALFRTRHRRTGRQGHQKKTDSISPPILPKPSTKRWPSSLPSELPEIRWSADLSYVEEVGRGIAKNMTGYKVIVTKSTVPVGTGEKVAKVIKANQTGRFRFDIVSNPEFLREGSAIEDFMRPNRVVIGADSEQAVAIMKDLYRPLYLLETPLSSRTFRPPK